MLESDMTPASTTPSNFSKNFDDIQVNEGISMTISAPGKVILFGEHSVVYDKLAVAASLGLRTNLSLTENEFKDGQSNYIKVELPDINLAHVYDLKDIQHDLLNPILPLTKSSSNYNWKTPKLINYAELLRTIENYVTRSAGSFSLTHQQHLSLCSLFYLFTGIFASVNIDFKPFTIHIKTELSISSGSGSSASYSVTIAAAFIHYLRLIVRKRKIGNISKDGYKSTKILHIDLKQFNEEELGIISEWAYLSEKIMHGTPSGIDNAICTHGALVEFRRSTGAKLLKFNNNLQLLLINTNVKRNTKKLVADVAVLKERYPTIVEPLLEAMEKVAQRAIDCLLSLDNNHSCGQEVEKSFYFLGQLTDINQHLLQAIGVSHPTLDNICKIVKGFNLNAKLTGAGGGGYAIVLIPPQTSSTTIDQLTKKLITKGFETALVDLAGPGVTIDFCNMNSDFL